MLSIRFVRKGKKKYPTYRIIVMEKGRNPQSDYLENLGAYNPHTKEKNIDADRVKYWISQGAQPTATAHNLLVTNGILTEEKVRAGKSKPGKKKRALIATKQAEETAAKKAEEAKKAAEAKAAEEAKIAEIKAAEEAKTAEVVAPAEPVIEEVVAPIESTTASTEAMADQEVKAE